MRHIHRHNQSNKPTWNPPPSVTLPDPVRERIRHLHSSLQADKAHVHGTKVLVWRAGCNFSGYRRRPILNKKRPWRTAVLGLQLSN